MAKNDYLRVLIRHDEKLYSFVHANCSPRDGSLNIILRRDGMSDSRVSWSNMVGDETPKHIKSDKPQEKNKKISIHQSGRIHLPDLRHNPIFIEPLVSISQAFMFCAYRIPRISALSIFFKPHNKNDPIIDLSILPDDPQSFELVIGPANHLPNGVVARIEYLRRYAFSIVHHKPAMPVRSGYEQYFTTISPSLGLFKQQIISEDIALIGFHQALNETQNSIIYGPNADGVWLIIFSVQSRIAPTAFIEPASEEHAIEICDQFIDTRINRACLRFIVKNKKSNEVIRELVTFRRILLTAAM